MKLQWLRIAKPILHAICIFIIFLIMYRIRLVSDLLPGIRLRIPPINPQETLIYASISALLFVVIGIGKNLYDLYKPPYNYFTLFSKVWGIWFVTITFIAYFGWGVVFIGGISRLIIFFSVIITFLVLVVIDRVLDLRETIYFTHNRHKMLIIAPSADIAQPVLNKLSYSIHYMYDIVDYTQVQDKNLDSYYMVFLVGQYSSEHIQTVFEKIRFSKTRFFHINEGFFLEDVVYQTENIGSLVAREYKHSQLDGWAVVGKRCFDIVSGSMAIVLLLPVWIIVALAIKLDSRGPILYIQKRVGQGGKEFAFIKFRSMYTHLSTGEKYGGGKAEKMYEALITSSQNTRQGVLPKIANDPRVTRVGKRLRKTSIDELPQVFSVVRGTMSLVGPRPHLPREVANYEPRQKRLLSIKPGITGYAQVFGRDSLSFSQEAKLDLYYIQHRSVFMDLYVIFATVRVVFRGK